MMITVKTDTLQWIHEQTKLMEPENKQLLTRQKDMIELIEENFKKSVEKGYFTSDTPSHTMMDRFEYYQLFQTYEELPNF